MTGASKILPTVAVAPGQKMQQSACLCSAAFIPGIGSGLTGESVRKCIPFAFFAPRSPARFLSPPRLRRALWPVTYGRPLSLGIWPAISTTPCNRVRGAAAHTSGRPPGSAIRGAVAHSSCHPLLLGIWPAISTTLRECVRGAAIHTLAVRCRLAYGWQ